ncbi:phosphatase PAP2 family protein [Ramlibacter sp. PS4R-6]|uniref:phosphatase PAP2 family protein n=1 Tax=Ramlibacter sp. PS4R-6 TaxID=3133438 RepID=UPI0030B35F32
MPALALAAALSLATPAFAWPAQDAPTPSAQGAANVHLWHAAARDAIARTKPNQQAALRVLAYLSLAQHETAQQLAATDEAAWSAAFDRVSADVLAGLLPSQAGVWQGLAASLAAARGGDERHADALAVAAASAQRILSRAASDGFDAAWTGRAPDAATAWKSQLQPARPPHLPQLGDMKTVWLANAAAVQSPAPPQPGSAAFDAALAEVRSRAGSGAGLARAKRWEMTGGSLVAGFWDETALELARREGLPGPQMARAAALSLGATLDANIVCHRVKYTHWVARPSQADPSIRPLVGLPNHPSYPSNHSCDSTAAAAVLGALFPRHQAALDAMAREAGESRIDGGIHYRFDVEAGEAIGRAAAQAALRRAANSVAGQ